MGDATRPAARGSVYAALAIAGWVVLWWPVVSGAERLFVRDLLRFALPSKHFLFESLADGSLPLWTPWLGAGQPWLADLAHQALYPLNLVYIAALALGAAPIAALAAFVLAHSLLGLLAMRVLLGVLGVAAAAAWMLGLAYAASGVAVSITDNITYLPALVWLPLALAATHRVLAGHAPARPLASLALCMAMLLLCGDVLDAGLLVLAVALLVAMAAWRGSGGRGHHWLLLAAVPAALALGVALAAVQLLPTLGLLGQGVRADGLTLALAQQWSLPPARALEFVAPFAFGAKYPVRDFMWPALYPDTGTPWFESLYLGLPLLLLALVAVLCRRAQALPWLVPALVLALLALGRHTPLHGWAHAWLPMFDTQRYPEKLAVWLTLLLVLLAGVGVAPMRELLARLRAATPRRDALLRVAATLAMPLALVVALAEWPASLLPPGATTTSSAYWSSRLPFEAGWLQGALLHTSALALALVAVLWVARRAPQAAVELLLAVAVLDLLWVHAGHAPSMPARLADAIEAPSMLPASAGRVHVDRLPPDYAHAPAAGIMRRIEAGYAGREAAWLAGAQWMRSSLLELAYLQPDTNVLAGVPVLATGLAPLAPGLQVRRASRVQDAGSLAEAGVSHVVTGTARKQAWLAAGLQPVADDADTGVTVLVVPGARSLVSLDGEGVVRLLEQRPGYFRVAVSAGATVRLVVCESWHPGWRVALDGQPASTPGRGPAQMLALRVPAGEHQVVFRYTEPRLAAGAALSALALLAIGWLMAGAPQPRRRRGLSPPGG